MSCVRDYANLAETKKRLPLIWELRNLLSTRCFGGGEPNPCQLRPVAMLGIAIALLLFPPSAEAVIRRGWYLESLTQAPTPTAYQMRRNQLGFVALSQSDSLSARVRGLITLPYLELQLEAGQIYGGLLKSTEGLELKNLIAGDMTFFTAELGRYFIDTRNHFGRVSLKLIQFSPAQHMAWVASLQTGIHATPVSPWDVDFSLSAFVYFNHMWDFLFAGLGTGRTHYFGTGQSQSIRLGSKIGFGQKSRVTMGESLLFSISPSMTYSHPSLGEFLLKVPIRIWLDQADNGGGVAYLSVFDTPAVELRWSMQL